MLFAQTLLLYCVHKLVMSVFLAARLTLCLIGCARWLVTMSRWAIAKSFWIESTDWKTGLQLNLFTRKGVKEIRCAKTASWNDLLTWSTDGSPTTAIMPHTDHMFLHIRSVSKIYPKIQIRRTLEFFFQLKTESDIIIWQGWDIVVFYWVGIRRVL